MIGIDFSGFHPDIHSKRKKNIKNENLGGGPAKISKQQGPGPRIRSIKR
jgi:hypothetical protein